MYSVQDLLVQICHNDKCIKYLYLLYILLFPLLKLYEKEYYRYLVLQNIENCIYPNRFGYMGEKWRFQRFLLRVNRCENVMCFAVNVPIECNFHSKITSRKALSGLATPVVSAGLITPTTLATPAA